MIRYTPNAATKSTYAQPYLRNLKIAQIKLWYEPYKPMFDRDYIKQKAERLRHIINTPLLPMDFIAGSTAIKNKQYL